MGQILGAILTRVCEECGVHADRYVPADRDPKPCECGGRMVAPARGIHNIVHGGVVCYGPSHTFKTGGESHIDHQFSGPREKSRWLKEHHMTEMGNESLTTVHKELDRFERAAEERAGKELEAVATEIVEELGDSGLYTSDVSQETGDDPVDEARYLERESNRLKDIGSSLAPEDDEFVGGSVD